MLVRVSHPRSTRHFTGLFLPRVPADLSIACPISCFRSTGLGCELRVRPETRNHPKLRTYRNYGPKIRVRSETHGPYRNFTSPKSTSVSSVNVFTVRNSNPRNGSRSCNVLGCTNANVHRPTNARLWFSAPEAALSEVEQRFDRARAQTDLLSEFEFSGGSYWFVRNCAILS